MVNQGLMNPAKRTKMSQSPVCFAGKTSGHADDTGTVGGHNFLTFKIKDTSNKVKAFLFSGTK